MKTHLTVTLHADLLWLFRLRKCYWVHVAVKYLKLVLDVGMKWKR